MKEQTIQEMIGQKALEYENEFLGEMVPAWPKQHFINGANFILSSPEIIEKLMEERGFLLSSIYENKMAVIESLSIENARLREQIKQMQK